MIKQSKYQMPRNKRRDANGSVGRFRGGLLNPVMAVPLEPNEGGVIDQSFAIELDPIAGRLVTETFLEMVMVYVPAQAIDALKDPEADFAGMTEVTRQKYMSGTPLFALETAGTITDRCSIEPVSIGGVMKVCESIRIGHNCAVNFLRQRKYHKATLLTHANTAVTPALLGSTILERLNGVLDPDDRINGVVNLSLPTANLPVKNMLVRDPTTVTGSKAVGDDGAIGAVDSGNQRELRVSEAAAGFVEPIYALFDGIDTNGVSLVDFYNAQKQDSLTREMRRLIDENPQYGDELALRFAHGMSMDNGHIPWVIAERREVFGKRLVEATDSAGVNSDLMRTDAYHTMRIVVPVPRTELGGVIYTFLTLKPEETIARQPHPIATRPYGARNFVADELALDPVPVTMREVDSECGAGNEATVAFYTGLNALTQDYVHTGLNRHLDPETVENKTAVWLLEIPTSVTADNIIYPADLPHFPFLDQAAEVATYNVISLARIATPIIFGPTPVEELEILTTEDIFEEEV